MKVLVGGSILPTYLLQNHIRMKKLIFLILFLPFFTNSHAQSYSNGDKILWLSRIWKDVSNNFYDPARLREIGWDSLYVRYASLVPDTKNDEEYFNLLKSFLASVKDGHTEFIPYGWMTQRQKSGNVFWLPFSVNYIDGKYYITGWATPLFQNIELPCELISVNGKSMGDYLYDNYMVYTSASTPQGRRAKALKDFHISFKRADIDIVFKDMKGVSYSRTVSYTDDTYNSANSTFLPSPIKGGHNIYRAADKNGTYYFVFDIKSFDDIPITKIIKSAEREVSASNYIVIDLRMNGGGNELIADTLLMSLVQTDTLKTYPSQTRTHNGLKAAYGYGYRMDYRNFYEDTAVEIIPEVELVKANTGLPTFTQPLFILLGENTFSAAEDFILTLSLHYPHRALLVGTPSGGSTGAPLVRVMPDNNYYRICTRGTTLFGDYNQTGIVPDIYYTTPIQDYIDGNDSIYDFIADYYKESESYEAK